MASRSYLPSCASRIARASNSGRDKIVAVTPDDVRARAWLLQAQDADVIHFQLQRIGIRGAEELRARCGATIAVQSPEGLSLDQVQEAGVQHGPGNRDAGSNPTATNPGMDRARYFPWPSCSAWLGRMIREPSSRPMCYGGRQPLSTARGRHREREVSFHKFDRFELN